MAPDEQTLALDAIVSLITIDATALGGGTLRLAATAKDGQPVSYGGVSYQPLPIFITGIEVGGRRGKPTLEVARDSADLVALMAATDDLVGATVSQTQTLAKYLDGATNANTTKHWPAQRWRVEGLLKREPAMISWRLASGIVLDGAKIPGRQVLRDVCAFRYRRWTGSAWDYTHATCPYRGAKFYDINDTETAKAADDVCSRRLSGCKARFGFGALPFGGFAGVGRHQ